MKVHSGSVLGSWESTLVRFR